VRFELSGQMPIYSFGRLSILKEMANAGLGIGQAQLQMARSQLELLVVQAYFGLQLADELADLLGEGEKYLGRARSHLERLREEDSEDYDDVDMLRLKVTESEVSSYRLDAARTARLALSGLEKLTGLPEAALTPAPKLTLLKAKLSSLDEYLDLAYQKRAEMVSLEAALLAQGLKVKYEKRGFLPVVFLAGYFTYGRAWAVEEQGSPFAYDPYNSWFSGAAVGIEYRLNGPWQVLALDEARAGQRKLAAQHKALAQKVAMEVEQAYLEVQDLDAKLELTRQAYKAARGWVIAKLDLYESGLEPFKDMADALAAFFKQRMAYAQARFDYNVALARLAHSCGIPLAGVLQSE
jgi:outer membrane protein TolC